MSLPVLLAPSLHPYLDDASVHIWWGTLQLRGFEEDAAAVLSCDERQRANCFLREKDRQRYVAARRMLREVLSGYTRLEAGEIQFHYGANGKPIVANSSTPIEFNLSHSRDWVAVAVSRRRVGIDIEYSRAVKNREAVADAFFSRGEIELLNQLPVAERDGAFLVLWTRKEALLKACGLGLGARLDQAAAIPESYTESSLADWTSARFEGDEWSVSNLSLTPELVGAVAMEGVSQPAPAINIIEIGSGDAS